MITKEEFIEVCKSHDLKVDGDGDFVSVDFYVMYEDVRWRTSWTEESKNSYYDDVWWVNRIKVESSALASFVFSAYFSSMTKEDLSRLIRSLKFIERLM